MEYRGDIWSESGQIRLAFWWINKTSSFFKNKSAYKEKEIGWIYLAKT